MLKMTLRNGGLAALMLIPCVALAQQSQTSSGEAVSAIVNALVNGPSTLVSGTPFAAAGSKLLSMLLLILISWKGMRLVLDVSSFNQVVAELVQIVMLWGLASFFMASPIQQEIAKGFDDLAATAAQSAGSAVGAAAIDVSSTQSMMTSAIVSGLTTSYQLFAGKTPDTSSTDSASSTSSDGWLSEKMTSLVTGQWLAAIANLIFRVFIALMVMGAVVVYCGQLLLSQVMVNIALILAPLLIPWIMWEASSFVFHGWLKFMIVAGVQKIVGALMFGMTSSFISQLTNFTSSVNNSSWTNFYYYAAAFVLMFILGQLMMQISSIANGLVSGMPTTAFRAPAAMTPGGMASGRAFGGVNASQGARGAIGGAMSGYKAAKAEGKGAMGAALGSAGGAARGMARGLRTTTAPLPRSSGGGSKPPSPPTSNGSSGSKSSSSGGG